VPTRLPDSLRFIAPLPEFRAIDLLGRPWRSTDLAGKLTLVGIWSTMCGPCRKEHSALQAFQDAAWRGTCSAPRAESRRPA
jgi:thiol-disulfide isomerase/thioredoxin